VGSFQPPEPLGLGRRRRLWIDEGPRRAGSVLGDEGMKEGRVGVSGGDCGEEGRRLRAVYHNKYVLNRLLRTAGGARHDVVIARLGLLGPFGNGDIRRKRGWDCDDGRRL
jgi:hypothetical protein